MVFAIQDTTYLDYDSHIKTQELGSISKNYTKHKQGLIMHSALIVTRKVVTRKGLPLGLASRAMLYSYLRERRSKKTNQDEDMSRPSRIKRVINGLPPSKKQLIMYLKIQ